MHSLPLTVVEPPSSQDELSPETMFPMDSDISSTANNNANNAAFGASPSTPAFHSAPQQQPQQQPGNSSTHGHTSGGNNCTFTNPSRIDTSQPIKKPEPIAIPRTPSLQICTDLLDIHPTIPPSNDPRESDLPLRASSSATSLPRRAPSIRTAIAAAHSCAGSISPSSVFSSPQLAALTDITPLPSPVLLSASPWKSALSQSPSRTPSTSSRSKSTFSIRRIGSSEGPRPSSSRRHVSGGLAPPNSESQLLGPDSASDTVQRKKHTRNRSLSEYVPDALPVPAPRKSTISGSIPHNGSLPTQEIPGRTKMHREEYLAVQRGIAAPSPARPPTPPRSTRSGYDSSDTDMVPVLIAPMAPAPTYSVKSIRTQQPRRYRMLRSLGQGTFSQVVLAVRDDPEYNSASAPPRLVAVKVVEYGPAGGADEERVEVSLQREVEILKSINFPSLVQLKAFGSDKKRALLVLDYCPGGDLFEFASRARKSLSPAIIRRIFAELVAAVRYLHANYIVHRDIKLENVLVNVPPSVIQEIPDWRTHPRALVTLTDLGLSRRIPQPPESPLLRTRCGSEDYAAPEILMGQPYDGRSTDGWAMGVLLYATMESRLPFDPLPGARGDPAKLRARTPHRIARCEWSWFRFADEAGEWDPVKGEGREEARACVEGLLRRSTRRMSLDEIAKMPWVEEAIDVPGGLKRGDIEVP
ncbi:CAMK protein kinase [Helicocarpus griseus UAMH5409]|uniref:CAMK protein kinase n=1 Tax=Helicocarpus griseus UAMH5409 TaxID=1447875 RepID=A0A2B7Y2C5_9EURO|nr:CAMK protein kinase [Helicocarpus griseus UAMH5409]